MKELAAVARHGCDFILSYLQTWAPPSFEVGLLMIGYISIPKLNSVKATESPLGGFHWYVAPRVEPLATPPMDKIKRSGLAPQPDMHLIHDQLDTGHGGYSSELWRNVCAMRLFLVSLTRRIDAQQLAKLKEVAPSTCCLIRNC